MEFITSTVLYDFSLHYYDFMIAIAKIGNIFIFMTKAY